MITLCVVFFLCILLQAQGMGYLAVIEPKIIGIEKLYNRLIPIEEYNS